MQIESPPSVCMCLSVSVQGFQGQSFDFHGVAGEIYHLLSDRPQAPEPNSSSSATPLSINARFEQAYATALNIDGDGLVSNYAAPPGATWMTEVGVQVGEHCVLVLSSNSDIGPSPSFRSDFEVKYGSVVIDGASTTRLGSYEMGGKLVIVTYVCNACIFIARLCLSLQGLSSISRRKSRSPAWGWPLALRAWPSTLCLRPSHGTSTRPCWKSLRTSTSTSSASSCATGWESSGGVPWRRMCTSTLQKWRHARPTLGSRSCACFRKRSSCASSSKRAQEEACPPSPRGRVRMTLTLTLTIIMMMMMTTTTTTTTTTLFQSISTKRAICKGEPSSHPLPLLHPIGLHKSSAGAVIEPSSSFLSFPFLSPLPRLVQCHSLLPGLDQPHCSQGWKKYR